MKSNNDKDEELKVAESVIRSVPDSKIIASKHFLDRLFDYKRITKLYNTYIEGVETSLQNTGNGRMYVVYNIAGAVTGRLSNSGGNTKGGKGNKKATKIGVSFHTLPREQEDFNIRNYVIAPDGYDFITVDKKAMELRVLAHVANERNMIKAFHSGQDLHDYTTGMTFNISKDKVSPEEWKLKRQICKEVSFLIVYGGGAFTLARKRNISETKAQKIIDSWMSTYPGIGVYMETVADYIKQFKYAKTIFGRYRHLPNIDSPSKSASSQAFRQGLNFTVQSPASDILLCGMIGTNMALKSKGFDAELVATVHDSIELISRKDQTKEVVKVIRDQLVDYPYLRSNFGIEFKVPLEVEFEVGHSFGSGQKYDFTSYA
jgi:DNA polymerase I